MRSWGYEVMRSWGHRWDDSLTSSPAASQTLDHGSGVWVLLSLYLWSPSWKPCECFWAHSGRLELEEEQGTRGETEADMHHRLLRSTQTGSLITSSVFESPRATRTERYSAGLVWRHHIASARLSVELIVLPYRVLLWHIFCGMILFQHTVQSDITTIMNKHCYPCVDVRGFLSALLSAPMPRWLLL